MLNHFLKVASFDGQFHSPTYPRNLGFQSLGQRIFEGWARNLSWAYKHAFVLVCCEFNWAMMQYKVSTIDVLWNLKDVPLI
jgi:hypothetical protein